MNMKELTTALSAGLNMLKGFCCGGKLCNGWKQVSECVIEFRFSETSQIKRIALDEIVEIGKCKIYDERNGFNKPYPNVILKEDK